VPGSNASDSTEIYQEGLRIPPLKLFDRGIRNDTLYALIERNVRVPVKVFGDLRAQLAACHISEQSLLELAARYGVEKVTRYMTELIDYSERMTRAAIRELPDGVYGFLDHIDDDGIDVGKPIPLKVTISKSDDHILVDWTGSSPQVKGAINNTLSFTKSASYCAIRSLLPANIPNNDGVFRAIEVTAPPGTIANAVLPAACAARGLTGFRMVDCMFGALSQMLPDKVFASSDGGNTGISIGGYDAERRPFIYVDFTCCAWGGRPYADGLDGNSNIYANMAFAIDRGYRDRAADRDNRLRIHPGCDGAGEIPRRRPIPARLSVPRRGGYSAGALRPARLPPLRALRRAPGQAVDELYEPGRRKPPAAVKADDNDPPRRRIPPRGRRRRRLGRPARTRSGNGPARCPKRAGVARRGARGLRGRAARETACGRRACHGGVAATITRAAAGKRSNI
jgi:hypothetical protein